MKPAPSRLTGGCWSTVRMSVFFTTRQDGVMEIWDIIYDHGAPVFQVKVADYPIQCIKMDPSGRLVALGAGDGSSVIGTLSSSLLHNNKTERSNTNDMFER